MGNMVIKSLMGFEIIKKLREERSWTLRELSTKMDSYPQQISKFELGRSKLTIDWIKKFAKVFGVDTSIIIGGGDFSSKERFRENQTRGGGYADSHEQIEIDSPGNIRDRNFPFGPDTVPILGQANASSKAVMLNFDDPIGEFPRHPNQKNVKNAYYVRIYDESMEPRYFPRELAAVNGNMSPLSKEDCIIQLKNGEVYIKRFIKTTSKEVICAQLNPAKEWKCLLAEVKAIHAVVGRG